MPIRANGARPDSMTVVTFIRAAIVEGALEPGERLREDVLAGELGVSRTPIREALRILTAEGYVESTPYAGSRVRAYDANEVDSTLQARALMEGLASRRATQRAQPHHIQRMEESCRRYEALGDVVKSNLDDVMTENKLFHDIILEASDSAVISDMVHKLWDVPMASRVVVGLSSGDFKRISEHSHRQLTKAIGTGDADWADAIARSHVQDLRDRLVPHRVTGTRPSNERAKPKTVG
jgi:DNA-binding GntR family transcriptional regulator